MIIITNEYKLLLLMNCVRKKFLKYYDFSERKYILFSITKSKHKLIY